MSLTTTRGALTQPLDEPAAFGLASGTTTGPLVSAPPLWMCAAAAWAMFWTSSLKQTRPCPCRRWNTAVPVPSGSPRSGCSAMPSIFTSISVPPAAADSSDCGHDFGAGGIVSELASAFFNAAPASTTRWYGRFADVVFWHTGVFAVVRECDACATPIEPTANRAAPTSSNFRIPCLPCVRPGTRCRCVRGVVARGFRRYVPAVRSATAISVQSQTGSPSGDHCTVTDGAPGDVAAPPCVVDCLRDHAVD